MGTVTFRLLDRKVDENSYFLHQNGTKDESRKLDFTNSYGILNPFFLTKDTGGRVFYRYIAGCEILEMAEQEKQKIPFNHTSLTVEFNKGADIVLDEKLGGILAKFLKMHPWNTKSVNHKEGVHDAVFFTYDPKEKVNEEYQAAADEDKALAILGGLIDKPERARAIASLFKETSGLSGDKEIYLGLRGLVRSKPTLFLESLASREKEILADVVIADRMGIIVKDAKAWFFKEGEAVILDKVSKNPSVAQQELVEYLMSPEGATHHRQLLILKQQKEVEMNAPVGEIAKPEIKYDEKGQVINPPPQG